MSRTPTLHVVLGASGGAGSAIVEALCGAGLPARGVNRSGRPGHVPAEVDWEVADLTDPAALARAVAGAAVVHMAAQPAYHRWPQEFPAMLDAVIAATAAQSARLVMVDNLYAYGPGASPMHESSPQRATDPKGRIRAELSDRLIAEHRAGRVEVVIGRASDYFGPHGENSGITALAIEPVSGTGALRWVGRLDVPHSCAYLPDVGRALVLLGTAPDVTGRIWHLPHAPAVTGAQFLGMVNDSLPSPRQAKRLGMGMLRVAAPFLRTSKEILSIAYQWTEPFVVDDRAFRARFPEFEVTPLSGAVADTVRRHLSHLAAA
jgi:nucleoside-diphosphate-sugar epimerase